MYSLTHTLIAVGLLAIAYYLGAYLESKRFVTRSVAHMLDKLERDGYIVTKTDKDGEKELVTISEVLAAFNRAAIEKDKL